MSPTLQAWLNVFGILLGPLMIAPGLIWLERRLLALWQERYGPNRTGPFGLLQPVADAVKLLTKEDWIPPFADRGVFVVAPMIVVATTLMSFAVVPVAPGIGVVDLDVGLLFVLAMASLGAYSVVLAGWASSSKYSLLGGLRGAAQMISYEVFLGLSLLGVVMLAGTFDLRQIVHAQSDVWFVALQPLGFVIFLVAGLAETHRLPFDLPEAEAELVAGYHAEYSSMKFGMFFVGEYLGIILVSSLVTVLFLGGWQAPAWVVPGWLFGPVLPEALAPLLIFLSKIFVFIVFFILMRASLPRPRYDQLMGWAWKILLPLSLLNLLVTGAAVLLV